MYKPNVLVLSGYGINCERETEFAFEQAGANPQIVHVNDVDKNKLQNSQILAFPGGFSYGDHTGAGKALANKLRSRLKDDISDFINSDKLVIEICNGFQVGVALGLVPAFNHNYEDRKAVLLHNDPTIGNEYGRYLDRWVDIEFDNNGIWTKNIGTISLPIAHGEGKFYTDAETLRLIKEKGLIAARYVEGEMFRNYGLSFNPNGSLENIAAISDETGRVLGIMPHPERAVDFTHLPNWPLLKEQYKRSGKEVPSIGPGIQILKNGIAYFK